MARNSVRTLTCHIAVTVCTHTTAEANIVYLSVSQLTSPTTLLTHRLTDPGILPGILPQSTAEGRGLLILAEAEPAQGVAAAPGQHRHPPQHAARPPRREPKTHRRHQEAEQES